jgi:hypothetical protein
MAPLTSSVRQTRRAPAGFPEIPDPAAVLLPERFRGSVAPSAAEATLGSTPRQAPLSPAPGGRDSRRMPETGAAGNERLELRPSSNPARDHRASWPIGGRHGLPQHRR